MFILDGENSMSPEIAYDEWWSRFYQCGGVKSPHFIFFLISLPQTSEFSTLRAWEITYLVTTLLCSTISSFNLAESINKRTQRWYHFILSLISHWLIYFRFRILGYITCLSVEATSIPESSRSNFLKAMWSPPAPTWSARLVIAKLL